MQHDCPDQQSVEAYNDHTITNRKAGEWTIRWLVPHVLGFLLSTGSTTANVVVRVIDFTE